MKKWSCQIKMRVRVSTDSRDYKGRSLINDEICLQEKTVRFTSITREMSEIFRQWSV